MMQVSMYDISHDGQTLSDERLWMYDISHDGHGLPGRWNLQKCSFINLQETILSGVQTPYLV
ncbi:hypothetical protein AALP_AA2G029000 [Arabis alpina]|uniref:Uncharacterized protein n=1 Tax=Arabis alpina TaxID=50452 RepID=A0A087HEZ0_ARAAL|nr:hypothetical protein AALP_AA2G029000 [Arabis alpina]